VHPTPPRGDVSDDPFRPLEDLDDPDTLAWVKAQNELTENVLSGVAAREEIRASLQALWDYPKAGVPFESGGRWFQMRNTGLQAQSALWVSDGPDDEGRTLIDPNGFSEDGTVSLTGLGVAADGSLVAYAASVGGSDFMTWRVRQVETGVDLPDVVEWSKFSDASWTHDGSGFFYGAVARPIAGEELRQATAGARVMFHRLGTEQGEDELVFEAPDEPDWLPSASVTADGRYLVVSIHRGTRTERRILVREVGGSGPFVALVPEFEAKTSVVGNVGPTFFLLTDKDAERGRIVTIELERPGVFAREVVGEGTDTLVEAGLYGNRLVCHYLHHAHSALRIYGLDGSIEHEVALPGFVSLMADPVRETSIEGRHDRDVVRYQVASFTESGALWAHDVTTGSSEQLRRSSAPLDPADFVTEQVFVESDDGTRIPMFITRRADVTASGEVAVLLYGYGGFDVPLTPTFSMMCAAWVARGGLFALANLRGGGEYGRAWHDDGRLDRKQNVFDDFCACARWLGGASGWSRPGRVAIWGGSNGGLLVGACVTQRPSLFGAAVADVGVFDMLRFHLWTIGWAWKSDFGDPEVEADRQTLLAYSPLHNVRPGECYPPVLLLTGDHDDRVVPAHSYKFAAALQAAQACDNPVLLRVETSAGHGMGKPTAKQIAEAADRLAFLELALGSESGRAAAGS
jgi:prolyl oligopeptidase